jgi:hypothetical protein
MNSTNVDEIAAGLSRSPYQIQMDLMLLIGAVVVAACFYPMFTLNHDTSWYLIATRMWLNGAKLYQDVMEINPPLAFYLTVVPLRFADLLGISENAAFCLTLIAVTAGSLCWIRALLRRSPDLTKRQQHYLLAGFVLALLLIPIRNFGQREVVMMALSAPYFALSIANVQGAGRWERIAIGFFAVVGLALKPYFLAAPLFVSCVLAFQSRTLRVLFSAQNVAIAAGCAAYTGFVWLRHPDYFEVIVPLARLTYDTFNADWQTVLSKQVLLILVLAVIVWNRKREDLLGWRILAVCLGSLASYLVQFKGWAYHLLPLEGYVAIFCLWLWARAAPASADRPLQSVLFAGLAFASVAHAAVKGPYVNAFATSLQPLAVNAPEHPRVLVLSSRVVAAFPLVNNLNGTWASRYPHQWFLTGAVRALGSAKCVGHPDECAGFRQAAQYALETNVEDFLRNKPQLVYVDRMREKTYFGKTRFDYIDFLAQDHRFSEAWMNYRRVGEAHDYELWVLDPTPAL